MTIVTAAPDNKRPAPVWGIMGIAAGDRRDRHRRPAQRSSELWYVLKTRSRHDKVVARTLDAGVLEAAG